MTDPAEPVREHGSIAEAVRRLTPLGWERLRKTAALYARLVAGMDPDDFIQEAFRRALDGTRRCPTSVDVVRFLCEVMRSIAGDERRKVGRGPTSVPLAGHSADGAPALDVADPLPDPEQELANREESLRRRAEALALFDDDMVAQAIVEGVLDNMCGEELRSLTDLDKTGYESKRRWIRRRIEKRTGVKP